MTLADFLRGRYSSMKKLPDSVLEFLLSAETGWTLEYIRHMSEADHKTFTGYARIYSALAPRNQKVQL